MRRLVRDLELEARGRGQKRDRDNQERRDGSVENRCGGGDPTNPIPVHAEIFPIHKNHADAGTVLILKNCINVETVHVRASMLTEVWIP